MFGCVCEQCLRKAIALSKSSSTRSRKKGRTKSLIKQWMSSRDQQITSRTSKPLGNYIRSEKSSQLMAFSKQTQSKYETEQNSARHTHTIQLTIRMNGGIETRAGETQTTYSMRKRQEYAHTHRIFHSTGKIGRRWRMVRTAGEWGIFRRVCVCKFLLCI